MESSNSHTQGNKKDSDALLNNPDGKEEDVTEIYNSIKNVEFDFFLSDDYSCPFPGKDGVIWYRIDEKNNVVLIERVDDYTDDSIAFPQMIDDKLVVILGSDVLYNCRHISSVTVPYGVVKMGTLGLADSLNEIVLPESIIQFGQDAFSCCRSIKNIDLPSGITKISHNMFKECVSLESIIIPDGVTEIEDSAFEDCVSLKSIEIRAFVHMCG